MNLPIDVVPGSRPLKFRWRQRVDTVVGQQVMDYEAALPATVERAVADLVELVKGLQARLDFTYCAYCGHECPMDTDGSDVAEHIKICPKHPMRDVEQQLRAAEAERDELRAALEALQRPQPAAKGRR